MGGYNWLYTDWNNNAYLLFFIVFILICIILLFNLYKRKTDKFNNTISPSPSTSTPSSTSPLPSTSTPKSTLKSTSTSTQSSTQSSTPSPSTTTLILETPERNSHSYSYIDDDDDDDDDNDNDDNDNDDNNNDDDNNDDDNNDDDNNKAGFTKSSEQTKKKNKNNNNNKILDTIKQLDGNDENTNENTNENTYTYTQSSQSTKLTQSHIIQNDVLQVNSNLYTQDTINQAYQNPQSAQENVNNTTMLEYASLDSIGNTMTDTLGGINSNLGYSILEDYKGEFKSHQQVNPNTYDNTKSYYTGLDPNTVNGIEGKGNGNGNEYKYKLVGKDDKPIIMQKDFAGVANIFAPNIYISNPPLNTNGYPDIAYSV